MKQFVNLFLIAMIFYCVFIALAVEMTFKAIDCSYSSFHPDYTSEMRKQCRERGQK